MAEVIPFPLSRRIDFVARQARAMASYNAVAAERYLSSQLQQQQAVLQRKGVDQDRIDDELIDLARAIRARLFSEVLSRPGGAR